MAIEEMKLLGITGRAEFLNQFVVQALLKCDVQIEDAKKIYDKGWKLKYYDYDYRVKDLLKKCFSLMDKLGILYKNDANIWQLENDLDVINEKIQNINNQYEEELKKISENQKQNEEDIKKIEEISRIEKIDVDIGKLYDLKYIKFRYGKIPNKNLEEIKLELRKLDAIVIEVKKEADETWIMYFTTSEFVSNIDGLFNIQKFERVMLPDDLIGKPREYVNKIKEEIRKREYLSKEAENEINKLKKIGAVTLLSYYRELQTYDKINNIKKYMAYDQNNTFYAVIWVPETNMGNVKKILSQIPGIEYVVREGENPPTKLKNNKIIRPFETLVKMYGMPTKDELDPTWFVALTTFIMFGFMFGDVGHGAVFFIIGLILMIKKKSYGTILFAGRNIVNDIWILIWKCIWKREYNKKYNN